jgi:hypothetical protein
MRSCATRSTKENGPAQTGALPKFSPPPQPRSARPSSGAVGELRDDGREGLREGEAYGVRVDDLDALELLDLARAVRAGKFLARSKLYLTASASSAVPS